MNRLKKILVIEDEQDISRILKDYLSLNGYEVMVAANGMEGLKLLDSSSPDFIIQDIMLPDMDGIDLCRQIREHNNVPILILSARGSDTDKVLGLGYGADDYMTKPFSVSELLARVQAHLRRNETLGHSSPNHEDYLQFGYVTIDKRAYKATVNGQEVSLSAKEFELLYFLAKNKNQVFSKGQLLDELWGYTTYGDENTITVYIRRLREKIEADASNPVLIKTVWGIGYKFNVD